MTENSQTESTSTTTTQVPPARDGAFHRLVLFGRRHPVITTLGLAGAGLFGGVEMALGALVGAGVASMVRRSPEPEVAPESPPIRERARGVIHTVLTDALKHVEAPQR